MFQDELRHLRESRKLTQRQLSEAIGVQQHTVSRWERGLAEPTLSTLLLLATFFCVSLDELADFEQKKGG